MSSRVGFVPLYEVGEYTDALSVGNLGLPTGFDEDSLELHVSRTVARARLAEVGHLSISGFRGATTKHDFALGGMSHQGVGTATQSMIATKAKLHQGEINKGELEGPQHGSEYEWLEARTWINNAEIEERIKSDGDRWDKGVYDPLARAKYMDMSLKGGILDIARQNTLGKDPMGTLLGSATLKYLEGATWMMGYNIMFDPNQGLVSSMVAASIYTPIFGALLHGIRLGTHAGGRRGHSLPPRIWSITERKHYDRLALLHARMPVGALIRAAKI
jgi:hypothetical protein